MPRRRDEARVRQARALAARGMTQAQAAAVLGVSPRTLRSWPVEWPANKTGRPPVGDGQASARTARRRRNGK